MTDDNSAENSDGLDKAETLRGDIRDMMLRELEKLPVIWADLPELERNIIRDRINSVAHDIVYDAIQIVHAEGAPSMPMIVGTVSVKKGINVTLTASRRDPHRHLLVDLADGADVLWVMENAGKYLGAKDDGEGDGEDDASFETPPEAAPQDEGAQA